MVTDDSEQHFDVKLFDIFPFPPSWHRYLDPAYNITPPLFVGLVKRTFLSDLASPTILNEYEACLTSAALTKAPSKKLALLFASAWLTAPLQKERYP